MDKKRKIGAIAIGIALLVTIGVITREYILEHSGPTVETSPTSPLAKRYYCDAEKFLDLYFYSDLGTNYVDAVFNDTQQATFTKEEVGGRYKDGSNTIELYEVNGGWEVHSREKLVFANCRLSSNQ